MRLEAEIPDFSREHLLRELENNLWRAYGQFGQGPDSALHDEGTILWLETPIPIFPYNMVLKFQEEQETDAAIDRLVGHFQKRQVDQLWVVHPTARPLDLAARLIERGLMEIDVAMGMARPLSNLPEMPLLPEGIEVREVRRESEVNDLNEFAAWRWGVPEEHRAQLRRNIGRFRFGQAGSGFRMWLAVRDGRPLAKVATRLDPGSAGLYAVATRPEARGLGLATALTILAMREARAAGQDLMVLHASPMAVGLYQRLGFIEIAPFFLYSTAATHI